MEINTMVYKWAQFHPLHSNTHSDPTVLHERTRRLSFFPHLISNELSSEKGKGNIVKATVIYYLHLPLQQHWFTRANRRVCSVLCYVISSSTALLFTNYEKLMKFRKEKAQCPVKWQTVSETRRQFQLQRDDRKYSIRLLLFCFLILFLLKALTDNL